MKFVTLLFFFIVTNTYAETKCSPEMETLQFNRHGSVKLRTSDNHDAWTAIEKKMIHKVVTIQDFLSQESEESAVEIFGDYYNGRRGSNAGEIVYYKVGQKIIALVHYWPGDNQYGAYVEVVGSKVIIHAEIGDGDIYCL